MQSGVSVQLYRFFFRQVRFQTVSKLQAREHVQERVQDFPMKLFFIGNRGCRFRELAQCVYASQQNCTVSIQSCVELPAVILLLQKNMSAYNHDSYRILLFIFDLSLSLSSSRSALGADLQARFWGPPVRPTGRPDLQRVHDRFHQGNA